MIDLALPRLKHLVVLGAHCDDIVIGAGGTLLTLCQTSPGLRVDALVFCGGNSPREAEERAALADFCPGAALSVSVGSLPDGRLPAHWDDAKATLEALRATADPDLVIGPRSGDAHQDHRTLAELASTVWRDHLILGYEIPKSDGDLAPLPVHVPLTRDAMQRKTELLGRHYSSQRHRPWYDDEVFTGLARLRGVECGQRYAEAFELGRARVWLGDFSTAAE